MSELALEHADVGGDKGALFGFVWKETSKLAGKDDVYSVNGDPHKLVAAMAAVQEFGWTWLMDPAELVINPAAPAVQCRHMHNRICCSLNRGIYGTCWSTAPASRFGGHG